MDNAIVAMRENIKEKQKIIDEINNENTVLVGIVLKLCLNQDLSKDELQFIVSIFDHCGVDLPS